MGQLQVTCNDDGIYFCTAITTLATTTRTDTEEKNHDVIGTVALKENNKRSCITVPIDDDDDDDDL